MIHFPAYSLANILIKKYIRMYDKTVIVVPVLWKQVIAWVTGFTQLYCTPEYDSVMTIL